MWILISPLDFKDSQHRDPSQADLSSQNGELEFVKSIKEEPGITTELKIPLAEEQDIKELAKLDTNEQMEIPTASEFAVSTSCNI